MILPSTPPPDDEPSKADELKIQALSKPRRLDLLGRLEQGSATPEMLRDEIDPAMPLDGIVYDLRVLAEADCVEIVESKVTGSTVEKRYRANPAVFVDPIYFSVAGIANVDTDFDAMNWSRVSVDELGLAQLSECLHSARQQIFLIAGQSQQRRRVHAKDPIPLIVGVAAVRATHRR